MGWTAGIPRIDASHCGVFPQALARARPVAALLGAGAGILGNQGDADWPRPKGDRSGYLYAAQRWRPHGSIKYSRYCKGRDEQDAETDRISSMPCFCFKSLPTEPWLELATINHAAIAPGTNTCALSACRPRTNEIRATACVACAAVESVHLMAEAIMGCQEANSNSHPCSLIFVSLLHLYDILCNSSVPLHPPIRFSASSNSPNKTIIKFSTIGKATAQSRIATTS